jgi:hypothetical protein
LDLQDAAVTMVADADTEADVATITAAAATVAALDMAEVIVEVIATAETVSVGEEEVDTVVSVATVSETTTAMEEDASIATPLAHAMAPATAPAMAHAKIDTHLDHLATTDVVEEMPTTAAEEEAVVVAEMTAQDLPMAAARHLPHANPMLAAAAEGSTIGVTLGIHAEEVLPLTSSDSKRA